MLYSIVTRKTGQLGHRSERGFTMIEMIAVFMLISIMAAISGPSMIGFLQKAKVTSAQNELQGLLKSAQRSAIRQGKACKITLPASETSAASIPISASCIPSDSNSTLKEVTIRHNFADVDKPDGSFVAGTATDFFNFKGQTDDFITGDLVIVLSAQDNSNYQKCIVVSGGLGLIRTGNYPSGDTGDPPVATSCAPGS
jgi:prepilin-type N-terminal cleavage/methylation domain-containing protein